MGFLGAHVTYDLSKQVGERVVDLRLRCLYCDVPTYEPLELSSNYSVLTTSYLAGGGDGYSMFLNDRLDYQNLGKCFNKRFRKTCHGCISGLNNDRECGRIEIDWATGYVERVQAYVRL